MELTLVNTNKLSIVSLGIRLTQDSTQEELQRALLLEPSLKAYIVESKTIKKDGKTTSKEETPISKP